MPAMMSGPGEIDAYIAGFPPDVRRRLQEIRSTIRKAAPRAREVISYKIPAFSLDGKQFIYFAGYKKHVAVYPVPAGDARFRTQIEKYRAGKGTLRFPLDKPIPRAVIRKIASFLISERARLDRARSTGR
jgi:uncharacterized protein YdhG (YjbR/CyaY superfamily)